MHGMPLRSGVPSGCNCSYRVQVSGHVRLNVKGGKEEICTFARGCNLDH